MLYPHTSHIRNYDTIALNMYLDGHSLSEIEHELYGKGEFPSATKSNSKAKEHLEKVKKLLNMPRTQKKCMANKNAILKNLELFNEHKENLSEFMEKENRKLIDNGFLDLSDL